MANYGAKILNNAVGSLSAQQAIIAATSNNIANVNTSGYARRSLELQTRVSSGGSTALDIGNGVEVAQIRRVVDNFIEGLLRTAGGSAASAEIQNDFTKRVDSLFSLTADGGITIGSRLSQFFSSLNDLAANPASIELRQNVLARANDLASSIQATYRELATLQDEADQRISDELNAVNGIAAQIAAVNQVIASREGGSGQVAADERDRRDVLLQQLSEKIGVQIVNLSDGTVNVTLKNGFALVSGSTARSLEFSRSPSFAGGSTPPSLSGGTLGYIVYDYSAGAGSAHVDLTQTVAAEGGLIGGLLAVRGFNPSSSTSAFEGSGFLVEVASRVESIARQLLVSFNDTYLGADENPGLGGRQASSTDLDGNVPGSTYAFFGATGLTDIDGDGNPELSDLAASGIDSFARRLSIVVTDPRRVAAGRDLDPVQAQIGSAQGDGTNARALADLQTTQLVFSVGSHSFTGTFEQAYNEALGHVGNASSSAELNERVSSQNLPTARNRRDEVSGVSLDEEFTSLIKFQKAYEASARMIKVAQDLLDQVLSIL